MEYTSAREVQVTEEHLNSARELGLDHGQAVASWNEEPAFTLKGMEECDPLILDAIPSPLSGEFSGDFSLEDLLRELDLPVYVDDTCVAYEDLITKYEEAWWESYEQELRSRV